MTQESLLDLIDARHVEILPVARAKKGSPDTAQAAADAFSLNRGSQRVRVLLAFYEVTKATDYRISVMLGINRCSAGKRRKELCEAGLIEETEERDKTDTNCTAVVWQITEHGREIVRARNFQ